MKNNSVLNLFRSSATVFSMKDIALIIRESDLDNLKSRVNYYVKTGILYSPRRGFYAKDRQFNFWELATKVYTPAYISTESVLLKEGIIFQYSSIIHVISYLSRKITCGEQTIIYRKIKKEILYNNAGIIQKDHVSIASKERAFLDTLYLFKDYHFDNLKPINWKICRELVEIYDSKRLLLAVQEYKNAGN